jgi:hypothetical protein
MAAGLATRPMEIADLVAMIDANELTVLGARTATRQAAE